MADNVLSGEGLDFQSNATSYDLLSINGTAIPDVKKGDVMVSPLSKYQKYEGEEGNGILDVINTSQIRGSVSYTGLMQSEVQSIWTAMHTASFPACVLVIYNPLTGTSKRFTACIEVGDVPKIIHDGSANAWGFSFSFEEIDDAPPEENT